MTDPIPGMGAIVTPEGVAFRVWAPHATAVGVMGSFNDWSQDMAALASEDNGHWYGFVPGAKPGDEYKFWLDVPAGRLVRNDPYARAVTNSVGNSIVFDHSSFDWQGDSFACPPHNELVIYELHVGSFHADGGLGTFDSVLDRLEHLKGLGVNAIQVMPVMEFAGDMSWGYNPAHPWSVESAYGGADGFKNFVRTCHQKGFAVIVDVVYNHFGPSDLDLWQFDGWSEGDKGGIWFYQDWRSSTPWGDTRPDYGRGEVRSYIHDNALMWLRDFHADGLRFDMTAYIRSKDLGMDDLPDGFSLLAWINQDIREEFPGKVLIAEDLLNDPDMVGTGDNQAWFHSQWDAAFVHPVRALLKEYDDQDRSLETLKRSIEHVYDNDVFARVVYTESHDEVANGKARTVNDINPTDEQGWYAAKRATLGVAIAMTSPGIPMLFQGQEFLQGGWFSDDHPLDWSLSESHAGIVQLHGDLARLRRNFDDDTRGLQGQGLSVFHVDEDAKVMAWHRWDAHGIGDDVVVVINASDEARTHYRIGLPAGGRWELKLNSDSTLYSPDFGSADSFDVTAGEEDLDGQGFSAEIGIAPYSALVYSWKG